MSLRTTIELYSGDGVHLRGAIWPAPPSSLAYVVAHGFTGSSASPHVRAICERLHSRGAAVLVLDFRGHGRSGGRTSIGVDEAHDLAAAVAYLRGLGHEVVAAVGFSMGASVVIRHAALEGGLEAVVSVSGPGLWYERGTKAMRRVHLAAETRVGRRVAARLLRTRIADDGWTELPESPVELAGRIAPTPLLIVHGDADPYFPLRHARALHAAAPGSVLWEEAGMGHAESATTPELVDRIDAWVRRAVDVHPRATTDG